MFGELHLFYGISLFYFAFLNNIILFQFFSLLPYYPENLFLLFFCIATSAFVPALFRYFCLIFFFRSYEVFIPFHLFLFLFSHTSLSPFYEPLFLTCHPSYWTLLQSENPCHYYHHLNLPSLFVLYFYILILFFIYLISSSVFDHLFLLQFYFKFL